MHACMHVCVLVSVPMHRDIFMCVCVFLYGYIHVCVCILIWIYVYMQVIAIILDGYMGMKAQHNSKADSWLKDIIDLDPSTQVDHA